MNNPIRLGLSFVLFLLAQVLVFNYLVLFQVAVPYIFLLFLLMLPLQLDQAAVYILAFGMGLMVDMMSDPSAIGLHTFSALFVMIFRRGWASVVGATNTRGLAEIDLQQQSALFYALYLLPLIFLHQLAYFLLEDFTFQRFFYNLWKAILGTVYTFIISYLITFIFYKR